MITYIIRRLLIMPITLLGITIMVFLIARFAPGSPAQQQMEDNTMDAETQKAERERIEKKYGLNLPYHQQYFRWWKNMFTLQVQATAWYDDGSITLKPVYTLRRPGKEYFLRLDDGSWMYAHEPDFQSTYYAVDDPEFQSRRVVPEIGNVQVPPVDERFADPVHVLGEADLVSIESLDEDVKAERLRRATDLALFEVPVEAPAWSRDGEELYVNPDDPARPIGRDENGFWFVIDPGTPLADSRVYPIHDEATLAPILGGAYGELPEEEAYEDKYPVPRIAVVYGQRSRLDSPPASVEELERLTIATTSPAPAGLWIKLPESDRYGMLWEAEEDVVPTLVRGSDGEFQRLISETRVAPLDTRIVHQTNADFLSRLADEARSELSDLERQPRVPRHAIISGDLVPYTGRPTRREIRRYSHSTEIFEVTLGRSEQNNATVVDEMKRRLPVTLLINLVAFPLIYAVAIPTGMLMAVKRGRFFDRASNVVLLGLWSIPIVLSATLLIGYTTTGGKGVEWFPNNGLSSVGADGMAFIGYYDDKGEWVRGWLDDRLWHLVLPVFCIVYGGFAYLSKQMRAAMLDNFTMDYVRTARAKGVAFKDIVFRHVLRNSLLPLITIFATLLPVLIAGSVFIEMIFNIEGMGLLVFRAVQSRDFEVIQSLALIAGFLNLTGLLLADVCYALADPRITHR